MPKEIPTNESLANSVSAEQKGKVTYGSQNQGCCQVLTLCDPTKSVALTFILVHPLQQVV